MNVKYCDALVIGGGLAGLVTGMVVCAAVASTNNP